MNLSTASDDDLNPELAGFLAPQGHTIIPVGRCRVWRTAFVGQAFLPVLLPVALQSFEQQSEDFPFVIFQLSFFIETTSDGALGEVQLPGELRV